MTTPTDDEIEIIDGPPSDDAAATEPGAPDGIAAESAAGDADVRRPRWRRPRSVVLAAGVALVVAIAVIAAVVATRAEPPAGVEDSFEGDGLLADRGSGPAWVVTGGSFVLQEGAVRADPASPAAQVVVDVGAADGELVVGMIRPSAGTGIVFRHIDIDNHWRLVYVPDFATWNVERVVDGVATFVTNTGVSSAESAELTVELSGPDISVWIDGDLRALTRDEVHVDATGAGLVVDDPELAGEARTVYEFFVFTPAD